MDSLQAPGKRLSYHNIFYLLFLFSVRTKANESCWRLNTLFWGWENGRMAKAAKLRSARCCPPGFNLQNVHFIYIRYGARLYNGSLPSLTRPFLRSGRLVLNICSSRRYRAERKKLSTWNATIIDRRLSRSVCHIPNGRTGNVLFRSVVLKVRRN